MEFSLWQWGMATDSSISNMFNNEPVWRFLSTESSPSGALQLPLINQSWSLVRGFLRPVLLSSYAAQKFYSMSRCTNPTTFSAYSVLAETERRKGISSTGKSFLCCSKLFHTKCSSGNQHKMVHHTTLFSCALRLTAFFANARIVQSVLFLAKVVNRAIWLSGDI